METNKYGSATPPLFCQLFRLIGLRGTGALVGVTTTALSIHRCLRWQLGMLQYRHGGIYDKYYFIFYFKPAQLFIFTKNDNI